MSGARAEGRCAVALQERLGRLGASAVAAGPLHCRLRGGGADRLLVMHVPDSRGDMDAWRAPGTTLRVDYADGVVVGQLLRLDEKGFALQITESTESVSIRWGDVERIAARDGSPHPWWVVGFLATLGAIVLWGILGIANGFTDGTPAPLPNRLVIRAVLTGLGGGATIGLLIAMVVGGEYWRTVYSGAEWRQLESDSEPIALEDRLDEADDQASMQTVPVDGARMLKWLLFGLVLFLVLKVWAP